MGAEPHAGPLGAPVRFGVLGVGRIGALHARTLAGTIEGARLVAVYDADPDAAARAAAHGGARVAESAEALIRADDVDAVVIASPTGHHADQTVAAADAGTAIFCEKPVALGATDTLRALNRVRDAGVPFQIGLNRRYDPHLGALARAVHDGRIGRPEMFRSLSSDPAPPPVAYVAASGGFYRDSVIHDLDLARHVMGEIRAVSVAARVLVDPVFEAHDDVDTSIVTLDFASGALGVLQNSRRTPHGYEVRVEVHGEHGRLVAEDARATKLWHADAHGVHADHAENFLDRFRDAYRIQLQAFVDALRSGRPPAPGPDDAETSLALALTADRARRSGRWEPVRTLAEWSDRATADAVDGGQEDGA